MGCAAVTLAALRRCVAAMVHDLTRRYVDGEMSGFCYLVRLARVREWEEQRRAMTDSAHADSR